MSFLLKPRIFNYYGVNAKRKDSFKDGAGKGINERYVESLAEDYDEEVSALIDNILDNLIVPKTIKASHISLMEWMQGGIVVISTDVAMRRKLLGFAHKIYNIKGTALSYEILIRLLGFDTVTINEIVSITSFDSDVTFDDPVRTFDSSGGCGCGEYEIYLTGSIVVNSSVIEAINRIIEFLEPINASLRAMYYNGIEITGEDGIFDTSFDDTFE